MFKSFIFGLIGGSKKSDDLFFYSFKIGCFIHWGLLIFCHFRLCNKAEEMGVPTSYVFIYFWFIIVVFPWVSKGIFNFAKKYTLV